MREDAARARWEQHAAEVEVLEGGSLGATNEAGEVVATDDHHGLPEPVKRVSVRVPVSLLGGLSDGAVEVLLVSTLRARQAVRS